MNQIEKKKTNIVTVSRAERLIRNMGVSVGLIALPNRSKNTTHTITAH
jgi:hypothetical protein